MLLSWVQTPMFLCNNCIDMHKYQALPIPIPILIVCRMHGESNQCTHSSPHFFVKMKRSNVIVFDFNIKAFSLVDFIFVVCKIVSLLTCIASHSNTVNLLIFTVAVCLHVFHLFHCIFSVFF